MEKFSQGINSPLQKLDALCFSEYVMSKSFLLLVQKKTNIILEH